MEKITSEALELGLKQFYGTEQWRRHHFNRYLLHTDGVEYFAQKAGAYWFIDAVAIGMAGKRGLVPYVVPNKSPFAIVLLKSKDQKAVVEAYKDTTESGNFVESNRLFRQKVDFTDCPEGDWKFFLIWDGEKATLLLPSEY